MTIGTRKPLVHLAGFAADDELARELPPALEAMNVEVRTWAEPLEAGESVEREVERGGAVPAVVLLRGRGAVAAARQIRTVAPAAQLIFVASWTERAELQPELRGANLGHGWSFSLPSAEILASAVRDAIATSDQRRLVRTTLDRGDVHVPAAQLSAQRVRTLAISDALLAAILRDAVDAIVATDKSGRIVSANPAASRLFGHGDNLVGMTIHDIITSSSSLDDIAGRMTSQSAVCQSGERIPIDATVSRVLVSSAPAGFVIIARDARERLAAEEELRRQAELTATIVNGIAEGVYVVDAFGNLLFMNPAAEEMLGWKRDELTARNIHDTIHARDASGHDTAAADCPLLQAIRSGVPLRGDQLFTRKDGSLLPVDCAVTPVRLQSEVIGGVFSFHDLTPYRQVQEQLRAEKDSLAQVNRAKDDFIATISHELRTPLTAILGWLQLVSGGNVEGGELNEALEAIETSARAQAQIVSDLLDVSRIISGKMHLDLAEVDIGDVVHGAAATLRPSADSKGIALTLPELDSGLMVCGDASRLNQVIWNLLSNAIKFTPAGGTVSLHVEDGGEHIRVIVIDTGSGIPPEVLPTIFERYRQADGAVKKGGLGLGLAIVRTLVERHGGSISILSEVGRGTTVQVELPKYAARNGCESATA